ncbi:MAG: hypothetical protein AB8B60_10930 [Sulfitobacter sp.]
MRLFEMYRVPVVTALWMVFVPLVFAFVAGAGAGTVFDGLATFAGTMWSIFGGASLILGLVLLGWVGWSAWRAGDLGTSKELNG